MNVHPLLRALLLLLLLTGVCQADNNQDREKLEKLKKAMAELKKELESTRSERDKLQKTLETSEKDIGDLSKKARVLQQELKERQQNLNELREERSQLNQRKQSQQAHVGQHINAAYRLGSQGSLRLLLNQQDPTAVARNLKYYDYVIRARSDRISEFKTTIERINSIEPEIAFQTSKLEASHQQLSAKRQQLQSAQERRRQTLARLNADISSQGEELKSMNRDRSRLEQLLNQVAEWLNDIDVPQAEGDFASFKGKLPWPTNGRVLKNFGTTRVSNKLRWQGLLIGSTEGSPVTAIHHGRIVFSDYLRGHGLLIIIDHGGGYLSLYAHNQALYKELGEWVDGGDVIASVGTSGGQQQSALYFELRYKGQPTNPSRWFKPA